MGEIRIARWLGWQDDVTNTGRGWVGKTAVTNT